MIVCDARFSSNLDWSPLRKEAFDLIAAGEKILWFLDFGLFNQLQKPLYNLGQFASFGLAIDHFHEKLWREFHKFSQGVVLYKGNADFSFSLSWDEQQKKDFSVWLHEREAVESELTLKLYARDVYADYLEQLSKRLSKEIQPYLIFNKLPSDPLLKALLTHPEVYSSFTLQEDIWKVKEEIETGIDMPLSSMVKEASLLPYKGIFETLKGQNYKLIPENQLITSWEGLDKLYYHPQAISPSGMRKIQGFIAAGGEAHPF